MGRDETFARALPLDSGRTALLVVDMQRAFVEAGQAMEVPPARDVVPRIRELVGAFRERRLPVVFTEFIDSPAAPLLVGELHPEHRPAVPGAPTGFGRPSSSCLEGDPSARVIAELAPRADVATLWPEIQRATLDIIRRAYARVLSAKELGDMLRSTS